MRRYAKGARFERRVKELLEQRGFFVIRAAASKPVDLVGIKGGKAILIECKSDPRSATKSRLSELSKLSERTETPVLLATRRADKILFLDVKTMREVNPSDYGGKQNERSIQTVRRT